ncbi:MAG: type II toxin-antitoxin system CcdA family antitoxin [Candidatus Methanoperedens sp.]
MVSEKQKLTLSVDKELVEKAKKLGVNISEITETVLRHVSETEMKEVVTQDEVNSGYKKLFDAMLPSLKKFGTSVTIGNMIDSDHSLDVELLTNGEFWLSAIEETTSFESISFHSPKVILSKFIESLIRASEINKEQLKELEIFRRIVEALTETTVSENSKGQN